jgi:hypothetical protein
MTKDEMRLSARRQGEGRRRRRRGKMTFRHSSLSSRVKNEYFNWCGVYWPTYIKPECLLATSRIAVSTNKCATSRLNQNRYDAKGF